MAEPLSSGVNLAEAAAAADAKRAPRKPKGNPILAALGNFSFAAGDGKRYARQTGWGANKVDHPDGGTNETIAYVVFRPFDGLDAAIKGRVYCERYDKINGVKLPKVKLDFNVSLPFLGKGFGSGDPDATAALTEVKDKIIDGFVAWLKSDAGKTAATKATKVRQPGQYSMDADDETL